VLVSVLQVALTPTLRHIISGKLKASECWAAISACFTKDVHARCYKICSCLYCPVHRIENPIRDYIQEVLNAQRELEGLGKKVSEEEISDILVMNLSPAFDTAHTAIITRAMELSLDEVIAALEVFDQDHRSEFEDKDNPIALMARGFRSGKGKRTENKGSSRDSEGRDHGHVRSGKDKDGFCWCDPTNENHCHHCGRPQHIAALCVADMPPDIKDWVLSRGKWSSRSQSNSPSSH
jgi:hypothetical protein